MLERTLLKEFGEEADQQRYVCRYADGSSRGGNAWVCGDLLSELSNLHEQVRQVMQGVAQALWPSISLPEGVAELTEKLKGARRRFRLWKISTCRQGAREAWAMVKTRYTKADPNHMAEVGPVGPDGKDILVSLVYGQVELAAKYSQQDCKLDRLLDGIEEEFSQSA